MKMLEKSLQSSTDTKPAHGQHGTLDTKEDFDVLIRSLNELRATSFTHGRAHSSFPSFSSDVLGKLNLPKFFTWVNDHKKKILHRRVSLDCNSNGSDVQLYINLYSEQLSACEVLFLLL